MQSKVPIFSRLPVLIVIILLNAMPSLVLAEQDDGMPKILRSGFLARIFSDTDPRDAKAAMELMTREVSRKMGLNTSPRVDIYPDIKAMTGAIRRGELDLASMPTVEYLRIREKVSLVPSFVGAHNNGMGSRYVLISHRNSGITSIGDLKGKTLLLLPAAKHELGQLWLDVLLMKAGKGNRESYFRQVKETAKISHAIMGVFFRQADAAIVTRAGLDTSRQLNPQLATQLVVLAESQFLSDGVTCFLGSASERFRQTTSKAINQLNETAFGRQLFTVFQTSGTTPFKPVYLEGVEELLHEHDRLKARTSMR